MYCSTVCQLSGRLICGAEWNLSQIHLQIDTYNCGCLMILLLKFRDHIFANIQEDSIIVNDRNDF